MIEIDWSKAPEGATHFSPPHDAFVPLWAKLADGVFYYKPMDNSRDWYYGAQPSKSEQFVERPKAEQWGGAGLPPVGALVECDRYGGPCRVMYASDQLVVVRSNFGEERSFRPVDIRPIRTPEQIAAEERESAIKKMQQLTGSHNAFPFAQLYDAGLRFLGEVPSHD